MANVIVEDGGQGSFWAAKVWSMVNGFPHGQSVRWESAQPGQCPYKSESKSVAECLLMEAEVVLH